MKISCIGAGPIGRSWARLFANSAHQVWLVDTNEDRRSVARKDTPAEVTVTDRLDTVAASDFVFEAIGENADAKTALAAQVIPQMPEHGVFVSSSSALPISHFVSEADWRKRSVIAHPLNPPDLVRVVEICPAPETEARAVDAVVDLLVQSGRVPVRIAKEVNGFVLNRLAMALFREAAHLVGTGVIEPGGLDTLVRDGLARRWVTAGPCETYHLNTDGSFADYFERIEDHLKELCGSLDASPELSKAGVAAIAAHQDAVSVDLAERRRVRNDKLRQLGRSLSL